MGKGIGMDVHIGAAIGRGMDIAVRKGIDMGQDVDVAVGNDPGIGSGTDVGVDVGGVRSQRAAFCTSQLLGSSRRRNTRLWERGVGNPMCMA